jgi:hypothetical protein
MKSNSKAPFKVKQYINYTQAAHLLGYSSSSIIRRLIDEGHLRSYKFPDTAKKMVEKNEVIALITPSDSESPDSPEEDK